MDFEKRIDITEPKVISKNIMRIPYDWEHPRLYDWNDPLLDWGYAENNKKENLIEPGFIGHWRMLPKRERLTIRSASLLGFDTLVKIDVGYLTAPEDRLKKEN